MAATSAADKLKSLKKTAKPKEAPKKASSIREIDFTGTPIESNILTLCELSQIGNTFDPLIEQHKSAVQDLMFSRWTEEFWNNRTLPANFKARLKKRGQDGKATTLDDCACNFILKVRAQGLQKVLPSSADLKEDQTIQEVLVESLMAVVGMAEDDAKLFAQEELEVVESTGIPEGGLEKMLAAAEGSDMKIVAEAFLNFFMADSKRERDKIPLLTAEQRSIGIQFSQKYLIKEGMEARVLTYVKSLEQLRKLLRFVNVTEQVSNFEFGISDEVKDRNKRITDIASRYINIEN